LKFHWFALASIPLAALVACGGSHPPPATVVHNEWTWMGGSNNYNTDQPGIYGTQGVPNANNSPGARVWACSWTDISGNFWLFGGYGWATASNAPGLLNDFWEYSNGKWAWMGGSSLTTQPGVNGVYGTMGTPAPSNIPGARNSATCWTDAQGNFWLYGGSGFDSTGNVGQLNDLWKYSNGEWTWVNGSNIAAQPGQTGAWQGNAVFGTKGVAAPGNTPGVRQSASGWADSAGNLWLFGGLGEVSNGTPYGLGGYMNDLWKYSNGMWTWMAGSDQVGQYGDYGTLGIPAPGNTPSARSGAATWTDTSDNLWLFGGSVFCSGYRSTTKLNDLWEYQP
jgi:hypothetical protein